MGLLFNVRNYNSTAKNEIQNVSFCTATLHDYFQPFYLHTQKANTHKMYVKLCIPKNIMYIFLYKQALNFHKMQSLTCSVIDRPLPPAS